LKKNKEVFKKSLNSIFACELTTTKGIEPLTYDFQQKAKRQNSWIKYNYVLLTFRELTYLIVKADGMNRETWW